MEERKDMAKPEQGARLVVELFEEHLRDEIALHTEQACAAPGSRQYVIDTRARLKYLQRGDPYGFNNEDGKNVDKHSPSYSAAHNDFDDRDSGFSYGMDESVGWGE